MIEALLCERFEVKLTLKKGVPTKMGRLTYVLLGVEPLVRISIQRDSQDPIEIQAQKGVIHLRDHKIPAFLKTASSVELTLPEALVPQSSAETKREPALA